MKITRFAFAGKWDGFGASGSGAASSASSSETMPGSSSEPPTRLRITSRRLKMRGLPESIDIDEFIQPKQHADHRLPGGGVQFFRVAATLPKFSANRPEKIEGARQLAPVRRARKGQSPGELHAGRVIVPFTNEPFGETLRLLVNERIVQEIERLQGSGARSPQGSADRRIGAIKDREEWMPLNPLG